MEYKPNFRGMGRILKSEPVRDVCLQAAHAAAARVRANTPVDTAETVASVHVEVADRADRAAARVVAGGAMVPLQFGNARTERQAPMTKALEQGAL